MKTDTPMGRDMPDDRHQMERLSKCVGIPVVKLSDTHPPEALLNAITPELARRYGVFPVARTTTTLTVALCNPMDSDALDSLQYILKTNVEAVYCDPDQLHEAIERHYGKEPI